MRGKTDISSQISSLQHRCHVARAAVQNYSSKSLFSCVELLIPQIRSEPIVITVREPPFCPSSGHYSRVSDNSKVANKIQQ